MKIQIDTTNKTIKIEEKVNLNELFEALNRLFPNNEWKEFSLETNMTINWSPNPIIVQPFNIPYNKPYIPQYPNYPWYVPTTYCNDDSINKSKFNVTNGIVDPTLNKTTTDIAANNSIFTILNPTLAKTTTNMANVGNNNTYIIPNPITDFNITPVGKYDWNVIMIKDIQQYSLNDGIFDVEVK
jgi:hypothetical protein